VAWQEQHRLLNAYGPTETTVCASIAEINPNHVAAPPIGTPVTNAQLYVLDRRLEPVPIGVAGEMFIGGACVARGYVNRPALTAGSFVANPFAEDGSRLYRTGDLARWRVDGQLEFLGRADEQVKMRGFRIELGEIEAALATHPSVRRAVVTSEGDGVEALLVAYMVPNELSEGIPAPADLRDHLRERLPEYMVPAVFIERDYLPMTQNGKLDRTVLSSANGDKAQSSSEFAELSSDTEDLIAESWARLLKVDRVGALDNFFEIGGNSLIATQMVSRLRVMFQTDIRVEVVFDHPTVRELARIVEEQIMAEVERMSEGEALEALEAYSHDGKPDEGGDR
jgi:hypothetical protein